MKKKQFAAQSCIVQLIQVIDKRKLITHTCRQKHNKIHKTSNLNNKNHALIQWFWADIKANKNAQSKIRTYLKEERNKKWKINKCWLLLDLITDTNVQDSIKWYYASLVVVVIIIIEIICDNYTNAHQTENMRVWHKKAVE